MFRSFLLGLFLAGGAFLISASEVRFPAVDDNSRTIEWQTGPEAQTAELTFGSLPDSDDAIPVLTFDARIVTPSPAGWHYYLKIKVNGNLVGEKRGSGSSVLLRRGDKLVTSTETIPWWSDDAELLLFFAPNSGAMDERVRESVEEGFRYCLDIRDWVNYLKIGPDGRIDEDKGNRICFEMTLTTDKTNGEPLTVVIRDINILLVPKDDFESFARAEPPVTEPGETAAQLTLDGARLAVTPAGGMELFQNGEPIFIESTFSCPKEPKAGFRCFRIHGNSDTLTPQIQQEEGRILLRADLPEYRLEREITCAGTHFAVRDTFRNTTEKDIGFSHQNLFFPKTRFTREARLCGAFNASVSGFFGPTNPTAFMTSGEYSVGIVAEDTVSRSQLEMSQTNSTVSVGTSGCGVPAGGEIVREWSIYPVQNRGYYDFINVVRGEWGVNYTIPGPIWFDSSTEKWFPPTIDPKVTTVSVWFEYCCMKANEGQDRAAYAERTRREVEEVRRRFPEMKLLSLLESNLIYFDTRTVDWGENLHPRPEDDLNGGKYGQFMGEDQSRRMLELTPFFDSLIRDERGNVMYDSHYACYPYINLMVQPEEGNSRYRLFEDQFRFLLDDLGLDGVYIDQFQAFGFTGYSENQWDGCSILLADDGTIARKRYQYGITGAAGRSKLVRQVIDRGKMVLVNGQSMTKEEQNDGRIAFQEMENDGVVSRIRDYLGEKPPVSIAQTMSHLGTPLALMPRSGRYASDTEVPNYRAEVMVKGITWAARNGLLPCFYNDDGYNGVFPTEGPYAGSVDVMNHLFPFTPVRLDEGVLIGKERTFTILSGTYTVEGNHPPTLYYYDRRGNPLSTETFSVTGASGQWQVTLTLDDWNEMAVIEVNP